MSTSKVVGMVLTAYGVLIVGMGVWMFVKRAPVAPREAWNKPVNPGSMACERSERCRK